MTWRLRDVRDDDGPALIALIAGCWAAYPGCVLDVDAEEPWLRAPAAAYERWRGRMWVVEDLDGGDGILGCCGVKPVRPAVAELKSMYVAGSARRRGIATALEQQVVATARHWGAGRVELWSDTRFAEGHAFYERHGYQRLAGSRHLGDLSDTTEYPFAKDL